MSELETATSVSLIEELTNRSTFTGIVVRSMQEKSGKKTIHKNWDITYNQLTASQVAEILEDAVAHFRKLAEAENE